MLKNKVLILNKPSMPHIFLLSVTLLFLLFCKVLLRKSGFFPCYLIILPFFCASASTPIAFSEERGIGVGVGNWSWTGIHAQNKRFPSSPRGKMFIPLKFVLVCLFVLYCLSTRACKRFKEKAPPSLEENNFHFFQQSVHTQTERVRELKSAY